MDALVEAAKERRRPRDVAIFLILRYTGMRRESVATLRVHHLDGTWGLRGVRVKGGQKRDIPLPGAVVQFLAMYVERFLVHHVENIAPDTPLFWSTWGRRGVGKTRAPMTGKNIWRLCKVYGRLIGYPELKPHDLRHGVAMKGLGTASRPRGGSPGARPCADRHDTDLRESSATAAQESRVVLQGTGHVDAK